ncbi:MAG: hypothetical protein WKF79_10355 [Nocardioides sp.]
MNPSRKPTRITRTLLALGFAATAAVAAPVVTSTAPPADAALRKSVNTDYTLLRRAPRSYVIGTAYRGWTFDAHGPADAGYRWGRVFGDLNTCLWIYEGAVTGSGATSESCPAASVMPVSQFTNGQIGGGSDDGATVSTVAGAGCVTYDGVNITGYGNVRPWEVPARASRPIATSLRVGAPVRWRYVSRDGAWVMVRNPAAGDTDGVGTQGWYFLPRGCLPATLP